ncbi:MAG: ABC transporter ATP-binding protein/permease [Dictyoglomus sp.]|nr:ABC transporter ATP-binding protein/permease [Dictyoglomus sp.]MCX7942808.1 ABC transporter ATP-binding protein/permease [Dictyoglomaceae bacterium]MDW8188384.1 ABC transporter ATP-binding protein [Dictyoglomus sp.]
MKYWKRIFELLKPNFLYLLGGFLCILIVNSSQLYAPKFVGELIDELNRTKDLSSLNKIALIIVGLLFLRSLFLYGQIYLLSFVGHKLVADLRNKLFSKIQYLSLEYFNKWSSSELISRTLQDTQLIQTSFLSSLSDFFYSIILLTGIILILIFSHWQLALATFIIIPLFVLSVSGIGKEIQRWSLAVQKKIADLTTIIQESIKGARIVRIFVKEEDEINKFKRENEKNFWRNVKIAQLTATQIPLASFLSALAIVFLIWLGSRKIAQNQLTLGSFIAFLTYVGMALEPATTLLRVFSGIKQASASFERIFEILDQGKDVIEFPNAKVLPPIKGLVEFENVYFTYDNKNWALKNINLRIRPGEKVAIVGISGAGKTSLVNLIPRFIDPTRGKVKIDGYDVREVKLSSLRNQIGFVTQETVIFHGTVKENIAYSKPNATYEEIIQASKMARAHDFIISLPNGYDTIIGEGGSGLSGGQAQRIAIARIILHNPRLVILDEATSSLDAESEALIQEALEELIKGKTTLIIAHRLSTIRKVDRIIVLDQGEIVEEGSHEELLNKKGVYARIIHWQLEEGEVKT